MEDRQSEEVLGMVSESYRGSSKFPTIDDIQKEKRTNEEKGLAGNGNGVEKIYEIENSSEIYPISADRLSDHDLSMIKMEGEAHPFNESVNRLPVSATNSNPLPQEYIKFNSYINENKSTPSANQVDILSCSQDAETKL